MKCVLVRGAVALAVLTCVMAPVVAAPPTVELRDSFRQLFAPPDAVKKLEFQLLNQWRLQATPFPSDLILSAVPDKLDYYPDITFVRNQDSWGGCFHYAALHAADILNEWECPYTPDLSFRYLEYRATLLFWQDPATAQRKALEEIGVCSEGMLNSNYDASVKVTDKDPNGNDYEGMDHVIGKGNTPKPTAANDAEAAMYRVRMSSEYKPTVDTIKTMLLTAGPVWASGMWTQIFGLKDEGHVVCIIGYNDTTREFRCLNSGGENWSMDGTFYLPYDWLDTELWCVRSLTDIAADRTGTPYAYSARIGVRHPRRNLLKIAIGVEGETPLVVWDKPNRVNLLDMSSGLHIDVALPHYAAQHWPPSPKNRWYLEITDDDQDNRKGMIDEFTLARVYHNPSNLSLGKQQVETFKWEPTAHSPYMEDKTVHRVTVPLENAKPRLVLRLARSLALSLKADRTNINKGESVTLTATLTSAALLPGGQPVPVKDREVTFFQRVNNRCVNKPDHHMPRGTVKTNAAGVCTRTLKLNNNGAYVYAAAVKSPDGTIDASSQYVVVTVGPVIK